MRKAGHRPNEYFVYAQLLAYATAKPKEVKRAETYIRESIQAKKEVFFVWAFCCKYDIYIYWFWKRFLA